MNYRHIYHAGNFADVLKHCLLITLIQALFQKNKPMLYFDTHAGCGKYDLFSQGAQKTKEYKNGVELIINTKVPQNSTPNSTIKIYQDIINKVNSGNTSMRLYPGSPLIIKHLLRKQDQMILTELHKEEIKSLKTEFAKNKQVMVHNMNGYLGLKAFLPPKCGRGLILIDPPFEEKDEFKQIITGCKTALERFPGGVYLIWHPIKDIKEVGAFYSKLKNLKCKNLLAIEFTISKHPLNLGLTSCGIVIINAPWQIEHKLKEIVQYLYSTIRLDQTGKWSIKYLKLNKS